MPPDLNSLPSSPSTSSSPRISFSNNVRPAPPSPSPHAAAVGNPGLHSGPTSRRRSSLMIDNHPPILLQGERPRPNHQRQPSLGALHQDLENEQEAQVNRLLHMIRIQQDQIARQSQSQQHSPVEQQQQQQNQHHLPTPPPSSSITEHQRPSSSAASRSPSINFSGRRRGSSSAAATSPAFHAGEDWNTRDFYHAETQTLARENQMLKLRIRDLERQISDLSSTAPHGESTATDNVE